MTAKHKGREIISSVNELHPSLRMKVQKSAHLIGFVAALVVVLAFFAFDLFPKEKDQFFLGLAWLVTIATFLGAYSVGWISGWNLALWRMGFVVVQRVPVGYHSKHLSNSSNNESSGYRGYSFGSSVSINPSSGRPMSGSSGVDTSGNPYGTRSW